MHRFYKNLKKNYYDTINNFLSLQVSGSKENLQDLKKIKKNNIL